MTPRLPAHRVTTAHMGAAYPFQAERGLGGRGVFVGRDVHSGSAFMVDGWDWYAAGIVTNPGMLVLGDVGTGKSALLKALCLRQLVFGRQCWFLDPKGEYDRLCAAVGIAPVYLRPGGDVRLNPLDPRVGGPDVPGERVRDAQLQVLLAVTAAALGRRLSQPKPCAPPAAGMFDGPTSRNLDLTAPVVSLNLRSVYESDALGILMVCAASWLKRVVELDDGVKRILVVDEAWAVLARLEVARWLRASWKLTRSTAVQNIAVVHRLSDLEAAGGRDSEQVRLARGLLSDSQIKVIFRQAPAELALVRELCQLSEHETAVVGGLPKGSALWKVGNRSFQVEHVLSAREREITFTDERMVVG